MKTPFSYIQLWKHIVRGSVTLLLSCECQSCNLYKHPFTAKIRAPVQDIVRKEGRWPNSFIGTGWYDHSQNQWFVCFYKWSNGSWLNPWVTGMWTCWRRLHFHWHASVSQISLCKAWTLEFGQRFRLLKAVINARDLKSMNDCPFLKEPPGILMLIHLPWSCIRPRFGVSVWTICEAAASQTHKGKSLWGAPK